MLKPILLTLLLLAAAVVGCGTPAMYDCAGVAITYPAMMAPVDGGWVAVDTSGARVRAVIELQIPASEADLSGWSAPQLQLRVASGETLEPSRLRVGDRSCRFMVPDQGRCQNLQGDPKHCVSGVPEERCFYAIRAEFHLAEIPELSQLAVLRVGESTRFVLSWR